MASNSVSLPAPIIPNIYTRFAVNANVSNNDIVMNATNPGNGQAPLSFKLAVNNDYQYYQQIYGVAMNVSGGFADIYLGNGVVVPGFNFGAFVGVDYYLDPANPGKLTWTPPTGQTNAIRMGRALDSTHLILDVFSQFVKDKGALYTSDGSGYDATILVGSNGQVLVADSAQTTGQKWAPAVVASAPLTYTTATRALGITPTFTVDIQANAVGKGFQVKTGTNAKIGQATLVAGTKAVANSSVTANSRIFLSRSTVGGTSGHLSYTKINATSFTILSSSATDTGVIDWHIIESIP